MFLKIKAEASGYPSWCDSDSKRDDFVKEYERREGIILDPSKINKNPGLRCLAKICLNSLWGKFGQRDDLQQCSIVNDLETQFKLFADPALKVKSIFPVSDDAEYITYQRVKDDLSFMSAFTSVAVAAYTTSQARIELYKRLDLLGERVLYFDTDSVIYTCKDNEQLLPTGDFLGEMTDELAEYGLGSYIDLFVSGGPKNYGYRALKGGDPTKPVITCKVRGITINSGNQHLVNINTLKAMVVDSAPPVTVPIPSKITRVNKFDVVSRDTCKTYQPVYGKRKMVSDYETVPWGYKRPRRE